MKGEEDWGVSFMDIDMDIDIADYNNVDKQNTKNNIEQTSIKQLSNKNPDSDLSKWEDEQRFIRNYAQQKQLESDEEMAAALHVALNNEQMNLNIISDTNSNTPTTTPPLEGSKSTITKELIDSISISLKAQNTFITESEVNYQLEQILGHSIDGVDLFSKMSLEDITVSHEIEGDFEKSSRMKDKSGQGVIDDRLAMFFHKLDDDEEEDPLIEATNLGFVGIAKAASYDLSHSASSEPWVDMSEIRRVISEDGNYYLSFKKDAKKPSPHTKAHADLSNDIFNNSFEQSDSIPSSTNRLSVRTANLIEQIVRDDQQEMMKAKPANSNRQNHEFMNSFNLPQHSVQRQSILDRNASIRAFREELFYVKRSSLSLVSYAFPTSSSVAAQWQNTDVVIENVHGGICVSIVLPYLRRVDVTLKPSIPSSPESQILGSANMMKWSYDQCRNTLLQNLNPKYWDESKVSKLYGVCKEDELRKHSTPLGKLIGSPARMLARSISNSVAESAQKSSSPKDIAIVPDILRSNSLNRPASFSASDVHSTPTEMVDGHGDNLVVGKRGLLKLLSRSNSIGNITLASNVEQVPNENMFPLDQGNDGGLPNLKESYGSMDSTKHNCIKVLIHAFRYTFPQEPNCTFENSEFFVELKLDGWNNTLSQHHISSQYDKNKGLLLIYIGGVSSLECFEYKPRASLHLEASNVPRSESKVAYHVQKQPFFPKAPLVTGLVLFSPVHRFNTLVKTLHSYRNTDREISETIKPLENDNAVPKQSPSNFDTSSRDALKPPISGKGKRVLARRVSDNANYSSERIEASASKRKSPIKRSKSVDSTQPKMPLPPPYSSPIVPKQTQNATNEKLTKRDKLLHQKSVGKSYLSSFSYETPVQPRTSSRVHSNNSIGHLQSHSPSILKDGILPHIPVNSDS